MNGLAERTWRSLRDLAFSMIVHAHVGDEFYDFALDHAWKIHNCLPIRGLQKEGNPVTPYELFYGAPPCISKFRVLFCPVVMSIGLRTVNGHVCDRRNNPERGIRGIHVGLANRSEGYLIYVPATNRTYVSNDVVFDEHFHTTHVRLEALARVPGGVPIQPHPRSTIADDQIEVVGTPLFDQGGEFTQDDQDVVQGEDQDTPSNPNVVSPDTSEEWTHIEEETVYFDVEYSPEYTQTEEEQEQQQGTKTIRWDNNLEETRYYSKRAPPSEHTELQRSERIRNQASYQTVATPMTKMHQAISKYTEQVHRQLLPVEGAMAVTGKKNEGPPPIEDIINATPVEDIDFSKLEGDLFQPAPEHWKQIMKLPPHLKKVWTKSFIDEIKLHMKMGTFKIDNKPEDTEIVPVTVKFRTKLQSNGKVDKLKTRMCLRGDKQKELADFDTWCAIASFRPLRKFLASAAGKRQRIYQLDFIGAFLQSYTQHTTFTIMPAEWKELMPQYSEWFGTPLRLVKALYGDTTANKCWDDELSSWLVDTYGFERCLAEPSIFRKYEDGHELVLINAVDDQLYYSTSEKMRHTFEQAVSKRYDVELMGQAHWYLQSRITQSANHDITIDQSRYIALICSRFLPSHGVENVTETERKRYAAPLPHDFVASTEDRSKTHLDVLQLQEEFGFEYASLIGMLIYLMNTAFSLHFHITKLAKFTTLPGRVHFKAAKHMLHHLRCNHLRFGVTYYADVERSPIYHLIKNETEADPDCPLALFTDSSWQDCPDTGRSTGCYILYHQGGIIDCGSFVPTPVAMSSAEAEYNALAHAMQAIINSRQIVHELYGNRADTPLSIPFFCDSESAIIMGKNSKDTKRTRHIQRRIHFVRDNTASRAFVPYKIGGKLNPADVGTKNLNQEVLEIHAKVMHTTVEP